jgi:hypothetical protein
MAPPLTGKSLILHPRILPNGAGADTIGAVHRDMPERGVAPGGLGRRTKEVTMTTKLVALVLLCLMTGTAMAQVTELMSKERNRFELSYATCLNRSVDLYFGWRP